MADFFELVRQAAREGAELALAAQRAAPEPPPMLLDTRAVAHALGVSTATIDRMVRAKRLPFVVVGQLRRFDLRAVRDALEASRAASPSEPVRAGQVISLPGVRRLSREGGP